MTNSTERRPTAAVGVVVFRDKDVLLIQRGKEPNKGSWSIPGGRQEWGETVQDSARREIKEETNISLKDLTLLDALDLIERDINHQVTRHYTLIDFYAFAEDDSRPIPGDDAVNAEFVPLPEALERVKWEETKRIISLAAEKVGL
ncbi:NUDIX hydrolase [Temperatibacter marinus]|uniref:NUDIX hydrolase n=1 Tax=Temperatibacter marinus TaxID=1456591 RepID=A0AA52HAZ1_9PROT|nr:NUDIX hydrolase [Temperatibacter marinus]WND03113.1 NUDIX hydrolase [Temperatibacter marinus]